MNLTLQSGFSLSLVALAFLAAVAAAVADPIPADCKVGDFSVACQAYTFNRFSAMEAIEKTAQTGARAIEFYPGQKFSRENPDLKFDHNLSDENIQKVKDQLAKFHVHALSYGVVGAWHNDEADWRKIFDFAKKMGFYSITTESVDDLDLIEKLVKEYDIRVGIHEHRKNNDPNYKIWDPAYVLSLVKDRDPRIGACADIGHWATSGIVPLDGVKLLRGRIVNMHLKDRKEIGKEQPDCILGTGASNISGILAELRQQGYHGLITLEYENNWDNSVPDVKKCVEFIAANAAKQP